MLCQAHCTVGIGKLCSLTWTEAAFFNRSKSEIREQNLMHARRGGGRSKNMVGTNNRLPISVSVLFQYLQNGLGAPLVPLQLPASLNGRGVCRGCVARSSRHATEKITCIIFCLFNINYEEVKQICLFDKKKSRLTKKIVWILLTQMLLSHKRR